MRRPRGFTLIEVLIAIGIFALIGLVAAALLTRTLEARSLLSERADRLQDLQRGLQRFDRDALQYAQRPIRDSFGDTQPALVLGPDGALEYTVHGWRNPLQLPRSELQRVRWSLSEDGDLVREFWNVLDRAQDSAPRRQTVLSAVSAFEVEIIDGQGGSSRQWPREASSLPTAEATVPGESPASGVQGDEVPIALRMSLDLAPFDRIERLLLLGEAIELEEDRMEQNPSVAPDAGTGAGEAADDAG